MAIGSTLARIGRTIWRWGRVVWVCRVPLVSALGGGYLLAGTAQARDWFADLAFDWWEWLFFFCLVFIWAWIVHAAARRALQHDDWVLEAPRGMVLADERRAELQRLFYWPALVVPRALGLTVFAFVILAIYRTRSNLLPANPGLQEAVQAQRLTLVLLMLAITTTLVFVATTWTRRRLPEMFPGLDRIWRPLETPLLAGSAPLFAKPPKTGERKTLPGDRALWIARAIIVVVLLITLVDPHLVAAYLPRLMFAPLLFAGVVLLAGEVAAWSHRLRTPLLLITVGIAVALHYLVASFHDVRWLTRAGAAHAPAASARQIEFREAVRRWAAANGCEGKLDACPRPILVAGAGGASRAGFFTATVVGALFDLGRTHAAEYGDVRKRVFAISAVSGGSVGAAVMRAAMVDAIDKGSPDTPPCMTPGRGSWFGLNATVAEPGRTFDVRHNWRDCFQAILAGDFLSPVVVGLAYRDNFPLPNPFGDRPSWADRAALLEQGFEQRYHRMVMRRRARICKEPSASSVPEKADTQGLCRPFGYHPDPNVANAWVPLLFLNVTSVSTGRRVIIADVPIGQPYNSKASKLLPFAYDLYELRDRDTARTAVDDIRLSTAAGLSARFPVISPHGIVRRQRDVADSDRVVDRLVDGGYFENDGLATIADVAAALQDDDYKLRPIVIRIRNEPTPILEKKELDRRTLGDERPLLPNDGEVAALEGVASIFRTLTATRSGHEDGHAAYLQSVVGSDRVFEIGVLPLEPPAPQADAKQMAPPRENPLCRGMVKTRAVLEQVSMSWWMSQPVQAYLDAQLCVRQNWERLERELRDGRSARRAVSEGGFGRDSQTR